MMGKYEEAHKLFTILHEMLPADECKEKLSVFLDILKQEIEFV